LRAANAELNIRRLGAVSSTYLPDYYGPMQGIDAGAPTDRLLVEWHLTSAWVSSLAEGSPAAPPTPDAGFPQAMPALQVNECGPVNLNPDFAGSPVLVSLPENFIHLSKMDPSLALVWRMTTRDLFIRAFAAGYAITGFTRVGGPAYLLEKEIP